MNKLISYVAHCATLVLFVLFVPAMAWSQVCTQSTDCTETLAPVCDGQVAVRYGVGTCEDSDADGVLNACYYEATRTECTGSNRCYEGECISTVRPSAPVVPSQCESVTPTQSTCSGNGGTLYWVSIGQSGSCVIMSETFVCGEATECVISGQQSYCESVGNTLLVDVRPASVGTEDGLSWAEWNRFVSYSAPDAWHASNGTCYALEGRRIITCGNLIEFVAVATDAEKTAVARRRLEMGR